MSITKGTAPDISEAFMTKIKHAFAAGKVYNEGDTLADCAYKQGQRDIVEWIERHARTSPTF